MAHRHHTTGGHIVRHGGTWMWQRIGRRGTTLLFLAMLDVIYAANLAHPPADTNGGAALRFIARVAPLPGWAALWAAVGAVCLGGAFVRHDRWAFTAAAALKVLWGSTFLFGWAIAGLDRGWVSGVVWLAFAGFVYVISTWPEPGKTVHPPVVDR